MQVKRISYTHDGSNLFDHWMDKLLETVILNELRITAVQRIQLRSYKYDHDISGPSKKECDDSNETSMHDC